MAYAQSTDVAALCANLLGGGSDFTSSTSPTLSSVCTFLSSGSSRIDSAIQAAGFSASVPTSAAIYDYVKQLNAFYGAGLAESTRINVRLGVDERTRADWFLKQFEDGLASLVKMDLSEAGLSQYSSVGPYAGGISESDVDTVQSDSDRRPPRVARGMFRFPNRQSPRRTGGS